MAKKVDAPVRQTTPPRARYIGGAHFVGVIYSKSVLNSLTALLVSLDI